jgi:hypothetical protein
LLSYKYPKKIDDKWKKEKHEVALSDSSKLLFLFLIDQKMKEWKKNEVKKNIFLSTVHYFSTWNFFFPFLWRAFQELLIAFLVFYSYLLPHIKEFLQANKWMKKERNEGKLFLFVFTHVCHPILRDCLPTVLPCVFKRILWPALFFDSNPTSLSNKIIFVSTRILKKKPSNFYGAKPVSLSFFLNKRVFESRLVCAFGLRARLCMQPCATISSLFLRNFSSEWRHLVITFFFAVV